MKFVVIFKRIYERHLKKYYIVILYMTSKMYEICDKQEKKIYKFPEYGI